MQHKRSFIQTFFGCMVCGFFSTTATATVPSTAPAAVNIQSGRQIETQKVRVRLKTSQNQVMVQGYDFQWLSAAASDGELLKAYQSLCPPKGYCSLLVKKNQGQFVIESSMGRIKFQQTVMLKGRELRLGSVRVPDQLKMLPSPRGVDLIAYVPLEQYVAGVVASEMPAQWPVQTLKAQAVAARSYVVAVQKERQKRDFDVEASVLDQVFRDITHEKKSKFENVKTAVAETQGLILHLKDRPLKAFFHSRCGGHTSLAKDVWGGGLSAGTTKDHSCGLNDEGASRSARWSLRLSKKELEELLGRRFQMSKPRVLLNSKKVVRSQGRITSVPVQIEDRFVFISGNELRSIVGFDRLKSTLFTVEDLGEDWKLEGLGHGHGVGLCQWGSRHLARQGLQYRDILKHYYPLAKIQRLAALD